LPASYYVQTTPYFFGNNGFGIDVTDEDDVTNNIAQDLDDFGETFHLNEDETTNSSSDPKEIVQAFNPYVKVQV
jgi:hypothetical protein